MSSEEIKTNMTVPSLEQEKILDHLYPVIAPENLENSKKVLNLLNDQLTFKISALLELKEISKYCNELSRLKELIKYCEFLQVSDDGESATYQFLDNLTSFTILNIPISAKKEEVKNHLELVNLSYNRLYKSGFYWMLATYDQETVICVKNSLLTLHLEDDIKIKFEIKNKIQIKRNIMHQIDRINYQKEESNLGVPKKSYDESEELANKKTSDDSEAVSWRKGSSGVQSFDNNE